MDDTRVPYLLHYGSVVLALTLALNVAAVLLTRHTPLAVPAGALAVFPPMVAAIVAGRRWARIDGVVPGSRQAWRWAAVTGLIYAAIQVLLLPLAMMGAAGIAPGLAGLLAVMLAVALVAAVIVNRIFVVLGARSILADHGAS